jgi:hypothetical protein
VKLGEISAFAELKNGLPGNVMGITHSHQIDVVETIGSPELPPHKMLILEGDPFILLRNIDTRAGLAKGRRCNAIDMQERTVVLEFDDGKTTLTTRLPRRKHQIT